MIKKLDYNFDGVWKTWKSQDPKKNVLNTTVALKKNSYKNINTKLLR